MAVNRKASPVPMVANLTREDEGGFSQADAIRVRLQASVDRGLLLAEDADRLAETIYAVSVLIATGAVSPMFADRLVDMLSREASLKWHLRNLSSSAELG